MRFNELYYIMSSIIESICILCYGSVTARYYVRVLDIFLAAWKDTDRDSESANAVVSEVFSDVAYQFRYITDVVAIRIGKTHFSS